MSERTTDIQEITVRGGLPGAYLPVIATAMNRTWHRAAGEPYRVFQERIRREARMLGAGWIVWGGLPDDPAE
jgi:hypothetical protein